MSRLEGKVVVITGAGSGMGRAAGILFASEGAKVVVADINAVGGKRKPKGDIQPEILGLEKISIDVYKARLANIISPASQI